MSLYGFCKYLTLITSRFYYHKVIVSGMENIPQQKPVLLAINHPNSFLDAVLVGAYLNRPTHFLARGDAFKNKKIARILNSLHMLPVYRLSEGKENLNKNNETFDACQQILEEKKVVLIFAEGLSENNWHLRSLKKGPARIALKAWTSNTAAAELAIVPIGLTYQHYHGGGKTILINVGKHFAKNEFQVQNSEAIFVKQFNQKITENLSQLAYINPQMEFGNAVHQKFMANLQQLANQKMSAPQIIESLNKNLTDYKKVAERVWVKQTLLFWPLYAFCNAITQKIIKSPLFFDSISFGLFLFLWPLYLLIILGTLIAII